MVDKQNKKREEKKRMEIYRRVMRRSYMIKMDGIIKHTIGSIAKPDEKDKLIEYLWRWVIEAVCYVEEYQNWIDNFMNKKEERIRLEKVRIHSERELFRYLLDWVEDYNKKLKQGIAKKKKPQSNFRI